MSARKFELRNRKFGNVEVEIDGDGLGVWLHDHLVAWFVPEREVVQVCRCGFSTRTTRTCLNSFFRLAGMPHLIWVKDWVWWITNGNEARPFKDEMELRASNELVEIYTRESGRMAQGVRCRSTG